jgi:hypothetical protein
VLGWAFVNGPRDSLRQLKREAESQLGDTNL